ncbi:hypothetical protein BU16DRAFT_475657 [Lophium mytilinum]|uniref:Zn(2)-C6 fungal-type domain-containing protein n=1 Tax=Lophium mytilinum TaxID=390894 RepID=A0A6A6RH58_9PEZI|nr:hypothetical protein BU16DRAFT_475657 [Lophium mytilinum]
MEAATTAIRRGQGLVTPTMDPAAIAPPDNHDDNTPPRKKQKRNKPTLSCLECVERKTKCDRGRPGCLACLKRQSECRYSEVANLIASADSSRSRVDRSHSVKAKKQTETPITGNENGSLSQKVMLNCISAIGPPPVS